MLALSLKIAIIYLNIAKNRDKMSQVYLSCKHISIEVDKRLSVSGWSLRECAEAFNRTNAKGIKEGRTRCMTKDVIHRVRNNQFEVVNDRVADLCNFLKINLGHTARESQKSLTPQTLQKEFEIVEEIVKKKPELEKTIKSFLRNIVSVATMQGEHQ